MYSVAQTPAQLAIPPPPRDQTHEVRALRALRRFGHEQWTCKEQGLAVTLVLENKLDLLVVMPTGHGKSTTFMIPPMVSSRTIIVVVPLSILVSGHEADASRAGLRYATYGTDTITFHDPSSILFVSVERATTPRFVELAHTLNHLQKLHCVVMDEAHLLLSDFRPVMKRLLPLWAVRCQLVALTTSLSPCQETDLKIVMSTSLTVIRMSMVCPLIGYVVDEVVDVDDEIIRKLVEWDCDVSSKTDRAIVYCLTREFVECVASIANNVACIRTAHLHAHLDENAKKAQLQSWLSGEARVMVATEVIGCGYNYSSIKLVIHRGSLRSFVALHQESGRLAHDGKPGISRVISSAKSRAKALHIDSLFVEPNAWITDTENCQRHNLHLAMDGQSQQCNLIPAAQPCDNCVRQSRAVSLEPPPPLPMLRVRATMLTSFMNEDCTSLKNFRRFAAPGEPNCLMCSVYDNSRNLCHPSQNCPLLLDGCRCFKCLGPHPRSDCPNSIPRSPDSCPKCHLLHNGHALGNVQLHEGRYGVDCPGQIRGERYRILLWAIWHRNPSDMHKAMPELKDITRDEELARWMGLKALGRSITNFTRLVDACI